MNRRATIALSTTALMCMASSAAVSQNEPPTYQGDPSVYEVIFEDQGFRVIAATWKKGVHDKAHSHPVPSVIYFLTNCRIRIHPPDDKTMDLITNAGTAQAIPITQSHSAENVGPDDCQAVFVERK